MGSVSALAALSKEFYMTLALFNVQENCESAGDAQAE